MDMSAATAERKTRPRRSAVSINFEQRVTMLEAVSQKWEDLCDAFFGTKDTIGFAERLRNVESLAKEIKKIGWVIIVLLLGIGVEILYNLVKIHPLP